MVEDDPIVGAGVDDQEKLNACLFCSPGTPKENAAGLLSATAVVVSWTGLIVTLPGMPKENAGLLSVVSCTGFATVPKENAG